MRKDRGWRVRGLEGAKCGNGRGIRMEGWEVRSKRNVRGARR